MTQFFIVPPIPFDAGLLLRSIIDKGVSNWYDILNDVIEYDGQWCDFLDIVSKEQNNVDCLKVTNT